MQGPDSTDPAGAEPQESDEIVKLRAEYARLKDKRAATDDPDICSVLDMRLKDLEASFAAAPVSESEPEPEEESEETKKLRAELAKLKEKRAQTKDRNIISVLDMRINQIEPFLPPPPRPKAAPKAEAAAAEEEIAFAKIPLPSAAESEKAEKLIKQSMLEKRRGNAIGATDLLKKAAEAAPGSPVVLEALADDLLERKLTKQARETYKRALQLDPKNVGLERKYAQTVLQTTMTMSVEDQLRYGMSDSLFITGEDNVAGLKAATFLSALLPGLGQMVVGRTTKGILLMTGWILCIGLFALWNKDFEILAKFVRGAGPSPNWRVLIPIIGMASIWITAIADLMSGSKPPGRGPKSKIERPKPPVDLPFD